MGRGSRRSFQIQSKNITEETKVIRLWTSGRQYPSDDCRLSRYVKVKTESMGFPSTTIDGGLHSTPPALSLKTGTPYHRHFINASHSQTSSKTHFFQFTFNTLSHLPQVHPDYHQTLSLPNYKLQLNKAMHLHNTRPGASPSIIHKSQW